jgi:hypothetical protein
VEEIEEMRDTYTHLYANDSGCFFDQGKRERERVLDLFLLTLAFLFDS